MEGQLKSHVSKFIRYGGQTKLKNGLVRDARNLVVDARQAYFLSNDVQQTIKTIPSLTTPNFGQQFEIDIREVGYLEKVDIAFEVSAISGITGASDNCFVPANLWFQNIEVIALGNGSTLLTYYPETEQIEPNLFAEDDIERFYFNHAVGNYADRADRVFLATKQSVYIMKFWSMLRQTLMPIPDARQGLKLRIKMKPLADLVEVGSGGTGTPAASIISVKALCLYSSMSNPVDLLRDLVKAPRHFKILDYQHQSDVIQSGQTTARITLTGISGYIPYIWFIVRATNPTSADLIDYTEIKDYAILDSGGNNLIGGNPIGDTVSRTIYGRMYCNTQYLPESGIHVYLYSFSPEPLQVVSTGNELGGRVFNGTEQLIINFSSALGSAQQVDVFAAQYSALQLGPDGWRKVGIF